MIKTWVIKIDFIFNLTSSVYSQFANERHLLPREDKLE